MKILKYKELTDVHAILESGDEYSTGQNIWSPISDSAHAKRTIAQVIGSYYMLNNSIFFRRPIKKLKLG